MWPFKPKLKLNFYDPEYDDVMNLFKQINYVTDIVNALDQETDKITYVQGILDAFVSIYETVGIRIKKSHKRKQLDFNHINWSRLKHDLKPFGKTIEEFKQTKEPYKGLLLELHGVMRESAYNKVVSETYVKILLSLTNAIVHLHEFPASKIDTCCDLYGHSYVRFLAIILKNMDLYKSIGEWLKQDQKAIEAYKPYLKKRIKAAFNVPEK